MAIIVKTAKQIPYNSRPRVGWYRDTETLEYEVVGTFKTYAEAVRAFGGTQTSYQKANHTFETRRKVYFMEKVD